MKALEKFTNEQLLNEIKRRGHPKRVLNTQEYFKFGEIFFYTDKEIPVKNWELAYKSKKNLHRLYVKRQTVYSSFSAIALSKDWEQDYMLDWKESDMVQIVFEAQAHFDGIRHLHFAPSQDENSNTSLGYINYPLTCEIINMLKKAHEIEKEISSEYYCEDEE